MPDGVARITANHKEHRRRLGEAAALWGFLTLGSIALMAVLVLWHLARRGRLLRAGLGSPRLVGLPEPGRPNQPAQGQDAEP